MPLTPDEIRARTFATGIPGYARERVQEFLERIAADYRGALEALNEVADSYGPIGREVNRMLASARETAEQLRLEAETEAGSLRREASDAAAEVLRAATHHADTELAAARAEAARLTHDAEHSARESAENLAGARANAEVGEIRRRAAAEAAALVRDARIKAGRIVYDAEVEVKRLQLASEREHEELIQEASRRVEGVRLYEDDLVARVEALKAVLARMTERLLPGTGAPQRRVAPPAPPDPGALADRLRAIDPELEQVAALLTKDD